jgi:hypothetical protein
LKSHRENGGSAANETFRAIYFFARRRMAGARHRHHHEGAQQISLLNDTKLPLLNALAESILMV